MKLSQNILRAMAAVLLLTAALVPLTAQDQPRDFLRISLQGYLVAATVDARGVQVETLEPLPELVAPGSIIQYEIVAFNSATGCPCTYTIKDLALLGAIPEGTLYLGGSATMGYSVTFSIDGGKTYKTWPIRYTETGADGKVVEKMATPDMVTGIRWVIDQLAPQKTIKLIYRVRVPVS